MHVGKIGMMCGVSCTCVMSAHTRDMPCTNERTNERTRCSETKNDEYRRAAKHSARWQNIISIHKNTQHFTATATTHPPTAASRDATSPQSADLVGWRFADCLAGATRRCFSLVCHAWQRGACVSSQVPPPPWRHHWCYYCFCDPARCWRYSRRFDCRHCHRLSPTAPCGVRTTPTLATRARSETSRRWPGRKTRSAQPPP